MTSLLFGRAGVPFLVLGGSTWSCGKRCADLFDLELVGSWNLLTPIPSCELPETDDGGGPTGVYEAAEDGGGPAGVVEGLLSIWLKSDRVRAD